MKLLWRGNKRKEVFFECIHKFTHKFIYSPPLFPSPPPPISPTGYGYKPLSSEFPNEKKNGFSQKKTPEYEN